MLVVNDDRFIERSEVIWEKGTNRQAFFRGEIDKYGWVDIGSSFLPSDMIAAFLWAQLECLDEIQNKRKAIWNRYYELFSDQADELKLRLPYIPEYATNNAHMFYLLANNEEHRDALIRSLKEKGVHAVFHYQSLHRSKFGMKFSEAYDCPNADYYTGALLRMPMYGGMDVSSLGISEVFGI